ncbi:microtubule-associated serine/threonine-protein kinase 3-like [Paralichthys olivaceus]|uniref:microtubule-associated serine/threonine-protein kinase 3-like n=1 Tax=Paralichthys olivaceus TaxID=8255 RepID=UPI003751EC92
MCHQDIMLPHGTNTMQFIDLQLLELAGECHSTIKSGMVSTNDFLKLDKKLEKLRYETRSAYSPPVRKPQMSDFVKIKNLSSGDFGSVELVRHKKTSKCFAMKLVKQKRLNIPIDVQEVFLERDILTFAENPFITSLACSFETDMYLVLVMDYVEGLDCDFQLDVLERFPVDMARLYVAETVMAVKYLHRLGIVHRDLTPKNMLISATGHIKLTDFGISKIGPVNITTERHQECLIDIVREFTDEEMRGTPVYMAPEVILEKDYGKPIDWWALGIILYEFLFGYTPFPARCMEGVFLRVTTEELTWPERELDVTDDAKDLIFSLLKKNPMERLGTRGAHEVKNHPFFQNLDMNNLLSEVPLYIPQLEYGDTCSENVGESEVDVPSVDEDEEKEDNISFSYLAFRFRKAYDSPTPIKQSHSSQLNLNEGNIQESAESLNEEDDTTSSGENFEDAVEYLDDEDDMTFDEGKVEKAAEILHEEEVMPHNEGNVKEATEILPHGTYSMWCIYLQLLELAGECHSTIQSGMVSTNDFLKLEEKLEKLRYEICGAYEAQKTGQRVVESKT